MEAMDGFGYDSGEISCTYMDPIDQTWDLAYGEVCGPPEGAR